MKGLGADREVFDAVEGIDVVFVVFLLADNVPSLLEEL